MQSVTNIRMSGLGGQGVVTAAHILGSAATTQGIASEIGGTELSANMAMLGGLLGITSLVDDSSFEKALTERFSGVKFIASATTAVLDDAVKGKYTQITQLIEKNMEVVKAAAKSVQKYKLN